MKKNDIAIVAAVVCLVGAAFGAHTLDKVYVTDERVTSVTDPYQFTAVTNGTYAAGKAEVTLETNAPDGSAFQVFASHPDMEEVSTTVTVKNGVAKTTFDIPEGLSTNYIVTYAVLDMAKQAENGAELAVLRYGVNGEKMTGDNAMVPQAGSIGQAAIGVSYQGPIAYPSEEELTVALRDEFGRYIESIVQSYGDIFTAVDPSAEGTWDEVNVTFTDYAVNEAWADFDDTLKQGFYDLFSNLVKGYKMVDEDTVVKVHFKDTKGNILDKNY